MKAFYRGSSYDSGNIEKGRLRAGGVASFRGFSFKLGKSITSASSFVNAQFRGHSLISDNNRGASETGKKSDRLSRMIESLKSKRLAH